MMRSLIYFYICLQIIAINTVSSVTIAALAADALNKLVQDFDNFKRQLDSIESRLKVIQSTVEQRPLSDDSKCIARDIIDAINNLRYELAEEKLNDLSDPKKISNIVHDVYADSPVNVDKILEFAKALKNYESQFHVLSAIINEIRSSGNSDPIKMIELVECLEGNVLKQNKIAIKVIAKLVIQNAIEEIKVTSISIFKLAMVKNKYRMNNEIENLAKALYEFKEDVSTDVIDRMVDGVFGVVAAERILENISSHKHIPQVITGLKAMYNRFNYAGNLNNDATIHLAYHLRELTQRPKYKSLSPELKDEVTKMIEQLPTCARNLFFNTHVCLWNKGRGQYLYAASKQSSYDEERRSIYTWNQVEVQLGALFNVEWMDDGFYFKNHEYANEYMYAVGIDYNEDMRYVFSWIPGNNTDEQSAWGIELDGEYCYIKTKFYNEYMFVPKLKYDANNNYVFTWKPGTLVRSSEFQWQARSCTPAEIVNARG